MKITGLSTLQAVSRPANERIEARKSNVQAPADSFQASEAAKNFNTARRAAAATPDLRENRIADIAARIQAGTYSVSAYDIASRLVDARV